jgi:hypothetical protein
VTVQLALAFKVAPLRLRLRVPALYVAVPLVQVVPGLDPFKLTGKALAATATPVSCDAPFGFVIVSVSVDEEPATTDVGENAAAMVGAVTELTVSGVLVVAVPPAPEFEAETAPVV